MITEGISKALADLRAAGCDADADRLESALTKAEAVEPVAEVYEWHTCGRDALGEAYRQSKGVAMRFIGPALPIGTKLYAHASSAEPAVKYTTGHCKNKAQPGGCQLHNLQCGYPSCDREPIQSPSVPVESLGRDAEPAGGLDAAMRTNGLPAVSDALGYSRNFAAANSHLTQTTKDHITGLCDMLELASAHQTTPSTPPPASVPDGWMPISSAPKGRKVIAGYHNRLGNWRTIIACYYPAGTLEKEDNFGDIDDDGYASEGWYEEAESQEVIRQTEEMPTHWQPLPTPPTNQEGAAP